MVKSQMHGIAAQRTPIRLGVVSGPPYCWGSHRQVDRVKAALVTYPRQFDSAIQHNHAIVTLRTTVAVRLFHMIGSRRVGVT